MTTAAEEARTRSIDALWDLWQKVHPGTPREHVEALVDDLTVHIVDTALALAGTKQGP